jgi:hypothetical protein
LKTIQLGVFWRIFIVFVMFSVHCSGSAAQAEQRAAAPHFSVGGLQTVGLVSRTAIAFENTVFLST